MAKTNFLTALMTLKVLLVIFFLGPLLTGSFSVRAHDVDPNPQEPAAAQNNREAAQMDATFKWFTTSTPGCAVAVMSGGDIIYSHTYGMANLEFGVPLTTDSVFPIDSMSKQFTGMGIVLLALRKELSFSDDVHKYIPELPDYGHEISIEDLLHQTSGLKDAGELLRFAGFRTSFDVQTKQVYLDIILRQHELNFLPGDQYLYSDTNYFVLGLVIERISGKPLSVFARQEIFEPLGMTHTLFRDDSSRLLPGRVSEYSKGSDENPEDGAFHNADGYIEGWGGARRRSRRSRAKARDAKMNQKHR